MKKILLVSITLILSVISARGQFASSDKVYYYQYVYSVCDGIKSKETKSLNILIVNIQNDVMGVDRESEKTIKTKMVDSPNYYDEEVINYTARDYKRASGKDNDADVYDGLANSTQYVYVFDKATSSRTQYTYREYSRTAHVQTNVNLNPFAPPVYNPNPMTGSWGKWTIGTECYSFSVDRNRVAIWNTNEPGTQDFYELIDKGSLIQSVSFFD